MEALEKAKEKANAYATQAQDYATQAQDYATQAQEFADGLEGELP